MAKRLGTGAGRENVDTVYQLDSDPALTAEEAALNDSIVRVAASPRDRAQRRPDLGVDSPDIAGDISIPVLSTHTIGELFVPFHMEQLYAQRVADHGASDLLVTRAIRDIGHCSFQLPERIRAFLPQLDELAFEGLVSVDQVETIRYVTGVEEPATATPAAATDVTAAL